MNAPHGMGNLPRSCILVRASGICGIANQRPGWSCDAKGGKSGRVYLSAMCRINNKREKMKRPYPKISMKAGSIYKS